MSRINDIIKEWNSYNSASDHDVGAVYGCADELEEIARTAWHPVSEPPVEEDADDSSVGRVVVKTVGGHIEIRQADMLDDGVEAVAWARIRDVVLLPPEDADSSAP